MHYEMGEKQSRTSERHFASCMVPVLLLLSAIIPALNVVPVSHATSGNPAFAGWQDKVVVKIQNPASVPKALFPVDIQLAFQPPPLDATKEVRVLICQQDNVEMAA